MPKGDILAFFVLFFYKLVKFIMYISYNDYKFGFLLFFLASLKNDIIWYVT